jgi:hypothetical protein
VLAGAEAVAGGEEGAAAAALCHWFAEDFAFADEFGGEAGGAAVLGCGASQDKSVAAILDNRLGLGAAVGAGDLGSGLEAKDAAAAEFCGVWRVRL